MDIRDWSLDKIMQLPDCCFGRRWLVSCAEYSVADTDVFAIVKTGVPDRAVIWELCVSVYFSMTMSVIIEFAWADTLPTTGAQWSALQKMFPCQGVQDGVDFNLFGGAGGDLVFRRLKVVSPASSLKPCVRIDGLTTPVKGVCASLIVSSIPKEVPDCLFSAIR